MDGFFGPFLSSNLAIFSFVFCIYLKVLNDGRFFGPFLSSNFALYSFVFFIYLKVLNDEVDHLATAHLELLAVHL